jgi:hypothetical protein
MANGLLHHGWSYRAGCVPVFDRTGGMAMLEGVSRWWCKRMHSKAMWPIHGKYICRVCLREYPISWVADELEATGDGPRRSSTELGLTQGQRMESL